jgi:hypothetical protein
VQKAAELFLTRYYHDKGRYKRIIVEIVSIVGMSLASIGFTVAFNDLQNNVWIAHRGTVPL